MKDVKVNVTSLHFSPIQLRKRLRNILNDSSLATYIVNRITTIANNSGTEFAFEWLKQANALITAFAAKDISLVERDVPWGVKCINNIPEIYHRVFKKFGLVKTIQVSNLYKHFRRNFPSAQSVSKEVTAVHTEYQGEADIHPSFTRLREFTNTFFLQRNNWKLPVFHEQGYANIGKMFVDDNGASAPPFYKSLQIMASLPLTGISGWESIFYPLKPHVVHEILRVIDKPEICNIGGYVNGTMEQGGKFRLFASPHKVTQCVLTPLMNFIAKQRDSLGTDVTKDQLAGALFAEEAMKAGKTIHSVDLSSATHRFPLFLQVAVMQGLGVPESWIELFIYCSMIPYKVSGEFKDLINKELVDQNFSPGEFMWAVGQPLGIKPSIGLFGLTHNMVLTMLSHNLSLDPKLSFRILGDDVIITDDELAKSYKDYITSIGVDISYSKTYSSTRYAEFAGYKITTKGKIRPGTFPIVNDQNFLDISKQLDLSMLEGEVNWVQSAAILLYRFMFSEYMPEDLELYQLILRVSSHFHNEMSWIKSFNASNWYEEAKSQYELKVLQPLINKGVLDIAFFKRAFLKNGSYLDCAIQDLGHSIMEMTNHDPIFHLKFSRHVRENFTLDMKAPSEYSNCIDYSVYKVKCKYFQDVVKNGIEENLYTYQTVFPILQRVKHMFMELAWLPPQKVGNQQGLSKAYMRQILKTCRKFPDFKPLIIRNRGLLCPIPI